MKRFNLFLTVQVNFQFKHISSFMSEVSRGNYAEWLLSPPTTQSLHFHQNSNQTQRKHLFWFDIFEEFSVWFDILKEFQFVWKIILRVYSISRGFGFLIWNSIFYLTCTSLHCLLASILGCKFNVDIYQGQEESQRDCWAKFKMKVK